jgi:hypothetical protein
LKQREVNEAAASNSPPQQHQQQQDATSSEEYQALLAELNELRKRLGEMKEADLDLKKSEERAELLSEQLRQLQLKNEEMDNKQKRMRKKLQKKELRWLERCKEFDTAYLETQKQHNAGKLRNKKIERKQYKN